MPVIGERVTFIGAPAGGVLSGTYPNPGFAEPMAPAADLSAKADVGHVHNAADLTSGTLSIDRIPTSTASVATAVPRADDPRLNGTRPWVRYDNTVTPTVGQVPTWNGAAYAPALPPSAAAAADATANTRGVVQLAGDLGGTAAEPVVTIRGPLGGHQPAPVTAGVVQINASVSTSFYVSTTVNLTIDPPTSPVDGQRILLEVYPPVGTVTAAVASGISSGTGVARSLNIPATKVAYFELEYTTRGPRWMLTRSVLELTA